MTPWWPAAVVLMAVLFYVSIRLERWRLKHTPRCPTCGKELD